MRSILTLASIAGLACVATACGASDSESESNDRIEVVVTTNILGDVVTSALGDMVGDTVDVEVIMPLGADPHDFAPSTRQAEAMTQADLLVVNGAGFEAGMADLIDNVDAPVLAAADVVELLEEDGAIDPHLWTDPVRMIEIVEALAAELGEVDEVEQHVTTYVDELRQLDEELDAELSSIDEADRVLVTNHEVLGYFADRYGFEVLGTVIPSLTTGAEASASQIEELAQLIVERDVPAVFGETTQSTQLADALTNEAGGNVVVVELYSESLSEPDGEAGTYFEMMRTNVRLIVEALGG
jgi:zinc/manganese transport system substrate-binding protein